MATQSKRLSARFVTTVTEAGTYADGDGLYLIVSPTGAKRWTFIFFWLTKRKEMGLGKLSAVSLADAREAAEAARRLVARGMNPIEARDAAREEEAATKAKDAHTFGMAAEDYVKTHASSFRNAKHVDQWRMTLSVKRDKSGELMKSGYCLALRDIPVSNIGTEEVLRALQPIWTKKAETASRLRGRIERVLDAAKVGGHRAGENPARWRGHLSTLLPKPAKLSRGHHAAIPYADLPAFMVGLLKSEGLGAQGLALTILFAARTQETTGAKWDEVDFDAKVWTVPPERMKAKKEHRVPISAPALAILKKLHEVRTNDFVLPGAKRNTHISNATMTKALGAAGGGDYTVHGFRSAFRDWVGEETSFPEPLAELALAHTLGSKVEAAYRRADALEKRRKLMTAWANYCLPSAKQQNVVPMKRGKAATA